MGNLCVCSQQGVRQRYVVGPTLGVGSFGHVKLLTARATGARYACKIVKKRGRAQVDAMFRNEARILATLDHPHVVKLVETFEDRQNFYAVLELCDGGELFTKVVTRRHLREEDAQHICRQIFQTLDYLHAAGIAHRDIKAENFLLREQVVDLRTSHIVLIDFGMSARLTSPADYLRHVCGSPHYVAPELIRKKYRQEVDIWAVGVTLYLMLFGKYPFEGPTQKEIAQKILKAEPDFKSKHKVSREAVDFIRGLLRKNPEQRLTARQALRHRWLDAKAPDATATTVASSILYNAPRTAHGASSTQPIAAETSEDSQLEVVSKTVAPVFAERRGDYNDDDDDEDEDDDDAYPYEYDSSDEGQVASVYSTVGADDNDLFAVEVLDQEEDITVHYRELRKQSEPMLFLGRSTPSSGNLRHHPSLSSMRNSPTRRHPPSREALRRIAAQSSQRHRSRLK